MSKEIKFNPTTEEKNSWKFIQNLSELSIEQRNKEIYKDIVTKAYIRNYALKHNLKIDENNFTIPEDMKDRIFELYTLGVLPIRLCGVKIY